MVGLVFGFLGLVLVYLGRAFGVYLFGSICERVGTVEFELAISLSLTFKPALKAKRLT